MQFKPGESGNPLGRPRGTQNKSTQWAKLLEPYAEELVMKTVELARQGDMVALKLCIERLIPKARHESVKVNFPIIDVGNVEQRTQIINDILLDLSGQEITLEQCRVLISILGYSDASIGKDGEPFDHKKLQALVEELKREY